MDHTLYALRLSDSPSYIDEIVSQTFDLSRRLEIMGADGDVEQRFVGLHGQEPMFEFETLAIHRAMTAIGITAYTIPGNTSAPDTRLYAYLQAMLQDGGRASGSNHRSARIDNGMIVPVTIQADQAAFARYRGTVHARWNGTTAPVVLAEGVALPSGIANDQVYTLGPVYVNGAQVPDVISVAINFGLRVHKRTVDGNIWPTNLSIEKRQGCEIRIRVADPDIIDTLGLQGAAQGVTDSVVYLRKKDADGAGNVADATAEHLSFTIDAGLIAPERSQASEPRPHEPEIVITPRYDGTNPIIAYSGSAAIP